MSKVIKNRGEKQQFISNPSKNHHYIHTNPTTNRATLPFHVANINSSISHRSLMHDSVLNIINNKQINNNAVDNIGGMNGSKRQSLIRGDKDGSKKAIHPYLQDKKANKENIYTGNVSRERSPLAQQADPKGKLTHRISTDNRQATSNKKQPSGLNTKKSKNSRKPQINNNAQQQQSDSTTVNFSTSIIQFNLKNEQKKLVQKLKQTSKSKNFAHHSNFFLSSTLTHNKNALQTSSGLTNMSQLNCQSQLHQNNNHLLNSSTTQQIPYYLLANAHRSPQNIKSPSSNGGMSSFNFLNRQSPAQSKPQHQTINVASSHSGGKITVTNRDLNTICSSQSQQQQQHYGVTCSGNGVMAYNSTNNNGRRSMGANSKNSKKQGGSYSIVGPTSRNGSPTESSINRESERKINQFIKLQQAASTQIKRVNNATHSSNRAAKESIMKHLSAQQSRKRILLAQHYEGSPPIPRNNAVNRKTSAKKYNINACESQSSILRGRSSASKAQKNTFSDQQSCQVTQRKSSDNKHQYSCTPMNANAITKIQMINNFMNSAGSPECSSRTRPDFMSTNASLMSNSQNKTNIHAIQASCLSVIKEKSRQSFGCQMFKSQGKDHAQQQQHHAYDQQSNSTQRQSTERSVNMNSIKPPLNNFSNSPKPQKSKIPSCRPSQLKASSQIHSESNSIKRKSSAKKQQESQTNSRLQTENLINFYQKITTAKKSNNLKNLISKEQLNKLIKVMKNDSMPQMLQDIERTMSKEKDQRRIKQSQLRQSIEGNNIFQQLESGSMHNTNKIKELNQDLQCHFSMQDIESLRSENKDYNSSQPDSKIYKTFKNRDDLLEAAVFGDVKQNKKQYPNSLRSSFNIQLQETLRKISQDNLHNDYNPFSNTNKNSQQLIELDQIYLRKSTNNRQMSIQSDTLKPVFSDQHDQTNFGTDYHSNKSKNQLKLQKFIGLKMSDDNTTSASKQQAKTIQTSSVMNQKQMQNQSASTKRIFHIDEECTTTPKIRANLSQGPSPTSEIRETPLHNTFIGQDEMQKLVEAKLHLHQFEKVFCKDKLNNQNDQSYLNQDEEEKDVSGITDFSLEFEMLNKLHVDKNTFDSIKNLPILNDQLLPDLDCSLYQESYQNGKIVKFSKDNRNKIQFKEPYQGQQKFKVDKQRLQQIMQNNYQILNEQSYLINQVDQSPFICNNDNMMFSLRDQSSFDNQMMTVKYDNENNMSYSNNFNPQQLRVYGKESFQILQEISGIGPQQIYDQNNYNFQQQQQYQTQDQNDDGVPQIVNMSNSEQDMQNNINYNYRQSADSQFQQQQQHQQQFNPFSTVLKCKKSEDMIYLQQVPRKQQNHHNILYEVGPSSQRPSSGYQTSPSSKSEENNREINNYMAQKVLGQDSFDELESIKEDSNIYFGNAPIKKGIHQRFLSRNSEMTSQSVNINTPGMNMNSGFGMFSRDYDRSNFQGILKEESQNQRSRQIRHIKQQSSTFGLNKQLFNSIRASTTQSMQLDSFIIPDDPYLLQQSLKLQQFQEYQRISVYREQPYPILSGMPLMQMQVYNAMSWFENNNNNIGNNNNNQPNLEYFNFDAPINQSPLDKTISPSSFESRNFPSSPSYNKNSDHLHHRITQNDNSSPTDLIMMMESPNFNDNSNGSISDKTLLTNKRMSILPNNSNNNISHSNQSSNNKYKRRHQPQQHPESRYSNHHQRAFNLGQSDQKRSTGTLMMINNGYKIDDGYDNDDIDEGANLLSESYSLC